MPIVLEELTDYVAVHFQMEEKLMRREEYPAEAIEAHVAEHRKLDRKTQEFVDAYAEGKLDVCRADRGLPLRVVLAPHRRGGPGNGRACPGAPRRAGTQPLALVQRFGAYDRGTWRLIARHAADSTNALTDGSADYVVVR